MVIFSPKTWRGVICELLVIITFRFIGFTISFFELRQFGDIADQQANDTDYRHWLPLKLGINNSKMDGVNEVG